MLRVRIKTKEKVSEQHKITLKQFFIEYSNAFFHDLNNILSDYHSIQEHTCRNKIIEFSSRKLKDLHLLQIFAKGAFLQKALQLKTFMGDDCASSSMRIVEMADFLALLFENMKTSFIPRPNFSLALQTYIDHKKLIPLNQLHQNLTSMPESSPTDSSPGGISPDDFDIIHRMMRIYLIKENISDFEIEKGVLFIKSGFFTFELALCGNFLNPQWQLYNVQSVVNSKLIEDQILKRINTIPQIVRFTRFYENRKNAVSIFNLLDKKTGFYQNFTGTIANIEVHGYFKDVEFHCRLTYGDTWKELRNPTTEDITSLIDTRGSQENGIGTEDSPRRDTFEFHREIFGPNETYFRSGMFFSLSKEDNVCFFGEVSPVCGLRYAEAKLFRIGDTLVGVCGSFQTADQIRKFIVRCRMNGDGESSIVLDTGPISPDEFSRFLTENSSFLAVAYMMKNIRLLVDRSINSAIFTLSSELDILVKVDEDTIKSILVPADSKNSLHSLKEYFSKKIDLIQIQRNIPAKCKVIENDIGEMLSLSIYDIQVTIFDRIETNVPSLECDCMLLGIGSGFRYILNFGVFYRFDLFPTYFTERKIVFKFSNFVEENVEITKYDDYYSIKGPRTLAITKIPDVFTSDDYKYFVIFHKFFLADRFILLKNTLNQHDKSASSNEISLSDSRRILLTQEGIKFKNSDSSINQEITGALNSEREIEKYIHEKIIG